MIVTLDKLLELQARKLKEKYDVYVNCNTPLNRLERLVKLFNGAKKRFERENIKICY